MTAAGSEGDELLWSIWDPRAKEVGRQGGGLCLQGAGTEPAGNLSPHLQREEAAGSVLTVPAPTRVFKKAGFTSPRLKATLFFPSGTGLGQLASSRVTQPAHTAASSSYI